MDLKIIQEKLAYLRDKIRKEGTISPQIQLELKSLLEESLMSAQQELSQAQAKLNAVISVKTGNQNTPLSPEQRLRLRIIEKTGTGSSAIH